MEMWSEEFKIYFRNEIRKNLENYDEEDPNEIRKNLEKYDEEDRNDPSKLYKKELWTLKPSIHPFGHPYDNCKVIEIGGFKWTFRAIHAVGRSSLEFELYPDDNKPRSNFYALHTVAIIHPHNYRLTECSDRFFSICNGCPTFTFSCEEGFLDDEGKVKVELQTQIFGENVFQPLLVVKNYRVELLLANIHMVNAIGSTFFKETIDNLKSLFNDENKWPRFCTFMQQSGKISRKEMIYEMEDKIKEALVHHFFVDGLLTSPLLMEILYHGYESIKANNTTDKFVRIRFNWFELVDDDVPVLFERVVCKEYKPIYESNRAQFGCMIVEIFVFDYLFRNKIEKNFTPSELDRTEKKSKKKVKKNGKRKSKKIEGTLLMTN